MAKPFLHIPSRQSPIAIFLILWKVVRQLVRQAWPFLLVIILPYFNFNASSSSRSEDPYITKIIIAFTVFSTISSLIAYFKFYYYIKDDEFIIEKGLFQKTKINLPISRIQAIHFEQSPIHQLFDIVRMEIDSAGSVQSAMSIQAINRTDAEYIRSFILSEREKLLKDKDVQIPTAAVDAERKEPSKTLMHHSALDLLKIGVSQNHLRGLGIIFGFLFWAFQSIENFLPDLRDIEHPLEYLKEELGLRFDVYIWLSLFIALLVFSIAISLASTVFRYYDLRFIKTSIGFKVIAGLLTKKEKSANLNKIQLIIWGNSLLKKWFGIYHLYLYQASSVALKSQGAISVPGCYPKQIDTVRQAYFPKEQELSSTCHQISPLIIRRRVLYRGIIPLLILLPSFYTADNYAYLLLLLWLPFIYYISRISHQNWKVYLNKEGLLTEQGLIGRNYTLLQWYKVQSVTIRQSLYQQRKSVADVYFFTAAGNVKIPYFPIDKALAIKNFVLYKVEIDKRDWM